MIIEKAKKLFKQILENYKSDPYVLWPHVLEMEKWAKFMLKKYPQADEEIVMLAVWLHDIGHYPIQKEIDHAVRGEARAKKFLEKENYPAEKLKNVLHCIRTHRCKDILPKTFEAKIIAFIDSVCHMTDVVYIDMIKTEGKKELEVLAKIERDFRDLEFFPEIKKELIGLYKAWKILIKTYKKLKIKINLP